MRGGDVGEVQGRVGFREGFGEGAGFGAEEGGGLGEAVEHEDFEGGGGWGCGGSGGGWHCGGVVEVVEGDGD